MKRMFVDHAGRVQVVRMTRAEIKRIARFWAGSIILTVACFIGCCVAAGLI